MDWTEGCAVFMGASAGVASTCGVLNVRSKDVNPEFCAGLGVSGAGGPVAPVADAGESLPSVRSSSVNPPLPFPPGSVAGAFSAIGARSAVAFRILSSSSGEVSVAAPPPKTTLWTTGSAKGFAIGADCGLAASGVR